MKNMNKMILYALMAIIVALPSCTKLDEEAFDVLPADNYYQDKNSVIAAVSRSTA